MIIGRLETWESERHLYPAAFDAALRFLFKSDWQSLAEGKHTIAGEAIYGLLQNVHTEAAEARRFEAHKKYLDIQVLLQGQEEQWYHIMPPCVPPLEDRLEPEDIAFYPAPQGAGRLLLSPGQYVVYAPGEQHKPCCIPGDGEPTLLKKIVFKLDYSKI